MGNFYLIGIRKEKKVKINVDSMKIKFTFVM